MLTSQEVPVHGTVFHLLKNYVVQDSGEEGWKRVLKEANLGSKIFLAVGHYPDEEAIALFSSLARLKARSVEETLEDFGRAIAPELLALYVSGTRPHWRTLDVLENTEARIHMLARTRDGADPPVLECVREGDRVRIRYESKRKLCAFGKGLIQGIADHFGEPISLRETTCMRRGDAACRFEVGLR